MKRFCVFCLIFLLLLPSALAEEKDTARYEAQLMELLRDEMGMPRDRELKAYRGFDSFRGESSEKTWLCRIAVNVCRDFERGSWFRHTDRRVTPDMLPETVEPPAERDIDLTLAIMALPRKLREAVILY